MHPNILLHPSPLNLANNKQPTNQQARLHSVFAITPCSLVYSTLSILEPRLLPCQIQVLSQKFTAGAPAQAPTRKVPAQICGVFGKKNSLFFFAQKAPEPFQTSQTEENSWRTSHAA